ncbi:MAG: SWIM zinc finger family protein, partial [Bacteroidota bacterium]|nr:SWIM zinc finger family protein [Bacteroidota bacterium]
MEQYGRTWWGQQWLKSLDRIDFTNRLPRGKSYARKGMVTTINIQDNAIQAKVKGSRPKPYNVNIIVPPFFDEEKKFFLNAIKNDSLLLSQLLNRQLPQELLTLAESKQIKIFPQSWQDIKLNCSCPDWAVPCKHLAAVIYTVAKEIDQNPFLVFGLHRFNLLDELSAYQMLLKDLETEKIFSLKDCISNAKQKLIKSADPKEVPDFSLIENLLPTLPLLFTSNPLFYDADFKVVIQNHYKRSAKNEGIYLVQLKQSKEVLSNDFRYYHYTTSFNEKGQVAIVAKDENEKVHAIKLPDLLVLLSKTESKHLESYSPSFVLLYRCFRFCNILAERGGVLPRLFDATANSYRIQWIPALINDSIKKVFDTLLQWYPEETVQLNIAKDETKKVVSKKVNQNKKLLQAKPEEGLTLLCSLFINASVKNSYNGFSGNKQTNSSALKINELFFNDSREQFSSFNEKEIPNTIQLWLNRFYIGKKTYSPVLQVHEAEDDKGFEVTVLMKDNKAPMQPVESLFSFMQKNSEHQFAALKDLQSLSSYFPGFNNLITSKGKEKLLYNSQTFSEV